MIITTESGANDECEYLISLPNYIARTSNLIAGSYCYEQCKFRKSKCSYFKNGIRYYEVDCAFKDTVYKLNTINGRMI